MLRPIFLVLLLALAALPLRAAHAVDVSGLSDFESDPCVIASKERASKENVYVPDNAMVKACADSHGSADVAWDLLSRSYKGDPFAAAAAAGPSVATGVGLGLLVVNMLLIDLLLGGEFRWLDLWAQRRAPQAARGRILTGAAVAILLRLAIGAVLAMVLSVPVLIALGGVAVAVAAVRVAGGYRRGDPAAPFPNTRLASSVLHPSTGAAGAVFAIVATDLAMGAGNVVALAAVARGSTALLVAGVLLAVPIWMVCAAVVRRLMQGQPMLIALAGVVLGWIAGRVIVSDPNVAGLIGDPTSPLMFAIPLLAAIVVAWLSWSAGKRGGTVQAVKP